MRGIAPIAQRVEGSSDDRGVSLIEILIAVVIIGTIGVGVLTSLRVSIAASATEREHARAHQWLQSATEVLVNQVAWDSCDTKTATQLQTAYESALQAETSIKPYQWQQFQIQVSKPVEFADGAGAYGSVCYADEDRQRITIEVRSPSYNIIETVEVVKIP